MTVSTSDTAQSAPVAQGLLGGNYARTTAQLMATINEIRATGAAADINLPTIVVAGNQSSGKSSLIEAISGINLPRSTGTCTKVPTEVRLKRDNIPWTCVVKIRREEIQQQEHGSKVEEAFGQPITDKSKVEAAVRHAQIHILDPVTAAKLARHDWSSNLEIKGSDDAKDFPKDVIVLEICGPEVTDLTLVDLPGLIQYEGVNGKKGSVELIEDMVRSYINKKCLILLVGSMTQDIQAQKATQLAREADPKGERTIGVLIRADMVIENADKRYWMDVLKDKKERLTHGYHVTRQPGADAVEAGIDFHLARKQEEDFFRDTDPWNTVEGIYKRRLGTKKLEAFLSERLSVLINDENVV